MTIVVGGRGHVHGIALPLHPAASMATAKTSRYSSTRLRRGPNSAGGAGSSTIGGHPLASADPLTKKDIKHRFEITAKLGSGTYGKVSLAYDHKMEREVAVKLIKKSAIENKQDLVRIRREIRIMSMLNHPNIIQIYEVFENKDKIILVMEYANGGELYDYVSKFGCLPEGEARRIFRQITSAVLYCHKHKVAHRDLKLENILLDANNNAKIADFGLSNYFGGSKSLLTTFCGSPLYASPEIINGTPYKGPEVDCWSLGILLYTLVYGSMPFDGRDFNRMVRQIKRGAYYEPDTPSTASMLVRNMLRVNPDRRATIYDIASHWWLNLEENMPVIQELPENQITDPTPLNERAEIMVVQELADETDVFMEFGHLSAATRRKIEEFRRRRKEAEEYNENSPIKPPKTRKTSKAEELTSKDKSLRAEEIKTIPDNPNKAKASDEMSMFNDPLERLRQLENRLQGGKARASPDEPGPSEKQAEKAVQNETVKEKQKPNTKDQKSKIEETKEPPKLPKKGMASASKNAIDSPKEDGQKVEEKKKPETTVNEPKVVAIAAAAKKELVKAAQKEETKQLKRQESVKAKEDEAAAKALAQQQKVAQKEATKTIAAAVTSAGRAGDTRQYWRLETDTLNVLMNQVLEQMERGPVSLNLVARIKAHPMYDSRPMVKELLESIMEAQPADVQREASKLISKQQSKASAVIAGPYAQQLPGAKKSVLASSKDFAAGIAKKPSTVSAQFKAPNAASQAKASAANALQATADAKKAAFRRKDSGAGPRRRPWHSVEVGFSTDSSSGGSSDDSANATTQAAPSALEEEASEPTLTPLEPESPSATAQQQQSVGVASAPKFVGTRVTRSEPCEDEYDTLDDEDEYYDAAEEDEEEFESDIDELAEVVEQVGSMSEASASDVGPDGKRQVPSAPKIVENLAESVPPTSPKQLQQSGNHLSTLERGLAKRQSKGKYQFLHNHNQVEMYGRGVSAEADSPPPAKRRIGGPQPRPEHSPVLFDKAKDYIMKYPDGLDDSDDEANEAQLVKAKREKQQKRKEKEQQQEKMEVTTKANESLMKQKVGGDGKKGSGTMASPVRRSSLPTPKTQADEDVEDDEDADEEDSEEEEEEEEEDSGDRQPFRPRPSTIIGFRTINPVGTDGVRKEAPIVQVKPQNQPTSQSSASQTFSKPTDVTKRIGAGKVLANTPSTKTKGKSPPALYVRRQQQQSPTAIVAATNLFAQPPSPLSPVTSSESHGGDENGRQGTTEHKGMHRWETAAAYIRRKNRERRARNATVAVTADEQMAATLWTTRFPVESAEQPQTRAVEDDAPPPTALARRRSSASSQHGNNSATASPAAHQRPSYLDERKSGGGAGNAAPFESSNYSRQTYVDRRKSFHELSPPGSMDMDRGYSPLYDQQQSQQQQRYGSGGVFGYGGTTGVPSNLSRYEEEVYNAFAASKAPYVGPGGGWSQPGQGWSGGPDRRERFEVYKTMAERAAETNPPPMSSYRNGAGAVATNTAAAYYAPEQHRPMGAYMSTAVATNHATGGAVGRSRFDDNGNFLYRRSVYELERPITPGTEYYGGNSAGIGGNNAYMMPVPLVGAASPESPKDSGLSGYMRTRPMTRRIGASLRDADGRRAAYTRSQSNDHMYSLARGGIDDYEIMDQLNGSNRYMTPEIGMGPIPMIDHQARPTDYGYVSYHDSGAVPGGHRSSVSQTRNEPELGMVPPTRGILKNKQAYEIEPRAKDALPTAAERGMFGRLRRHLSADKSIDEPPPEFGARKLRYGSNEHLLSTCTHLPSYAPSYGGIGGGLFDHQGMVRGKTPNDIADPFDSSGGTSVAAGTKKRGSRGILDMARRRTTEVRMLPEGIGNSTKNPASSYLDDDYKRPRSPIDRIKSLFSSKTKSSKDPVGSQAYGTFQAYGNYAPSPMASAAPSTTSSRFTSSPSTYGGGGGGTISGNYHQYHQPSGYQPSSYQPTGYPPSSYQPSPKRYTGGNTTGNLNRYTGTGSYNPGGTRNWYEDTHL